MNDIERARIRRLALQLFGGDARSMTGEFDLRICSICDGPLALVEIIPDHVEPERLQGKPLFLPLPHRASCGELCTGGVMPTDMREAAHGSAGVPCRACGYLRKAK